MEFSGCIWLGVEDFFEAKRSGMKDLHLCMNMVVFFFFSYVFFRGFFPSQVFPRVSSPLHLPFSGCSSPMPYRAFLK